MNIKEKIMNRMEFLTKMQDILQYEHEEELTYNTNLLDVEEWDSISIISTVAFLDSEFGKKVTVSDLQDVDTLEDIAKIAGI